MMKFCPNCGTQVSEQTKFCSNCGEKLEQQPVMPAEPAAPEAVSQKPLYTPPAPPASPAPPAQSYTPPAPPVQNYAPPVQSYAPPAPPVQNFGQSVPGYVPAKPAGKKSSLPLFLGIGAAVVLIILAVIFLPKLLGGGSDVLGRYEGVSISMMGMKLEGEELESMGDTWIELKEDDAFVLMLMGDKVKGDWSLDGREITLEADGEELSGTLKDGVLELKMEEEDMEMELVFEKGSGKRDGKTESPTEKPGEPVDEVEEAGYWTLLEVQADDPDNAMDAETVKAMKTLGIEIFLNLFADGTGEGSVYMATHIQWGGGEMKLTDLYMDCEYSVNEGQLVLILPEEDAEYIFVPGEGEAPKVTFSEVPEDTADATGAVAIGDYSWWEGDWYGWWIISDATGTYTEDIENFWDACATMELTGPDTGRFIIWDTNGGSKEMFLADVNVEFAEGWGDNGCMISKDGAFLGAQVGYYDWLVDPELCDVSEFEDMISISGHYVNPSNTENTFDYIIILRPWGMKWEDVKTADTSDSLYDDMMPGNYESWYLPLLEEGAKKAPVSFAE